MLIYLVCLLLDCFLFISYVLLLLLACCITLSLPIALIINVLAGSIATEELILIQLAVLQMTTTTIH